MSVKFGLLGLIGQKPRHGYELHAAFTAIVGGEDNWEVKPAQIYTTLNRLKEQGLIIEESILQEGGPEKVIYAITPEGLAELEDWFLSPVSIERQKDEFFIKMMLAIASGQVDPYKILYAQRGNLYRELHQLTANKLSLNPAESLAYLMLAEQAIMHVEADLRWLDMLEARLDDIRKQPIPEPAPKKPRGRPAKGIKEDGQ